MTSHSEGLNANGKPSDRCLTDPEPGMELRQAQFRNMHSKCRCSCVLRFTRHHRVSSVLHRPPSRMIHCIVLCLDSQTYSVRAPARELDKQAQLHIPARGRSQLESRRELFEPLDIPSRTNSTRLRVPVVGVRYLDSEPSQSDPRQTIRSPTHDVAGPVRQSRTARTVAKTAKVPRMLQFIQQRCQTNR